MSLAVAVDHGEGPLVVLLHGFPELPSCWATQIEPLAAAGLRVVAPYLRGYPPSPVPVDPAAYTADLLAGDVVELIDRLGAPVALLIGHDWGAQLAWWTAQLHPDRVAALAALSVPWTPRPRTPPLARLREWAGGRFFYLDYFTTPGPMEAEFGADPARLLAGMYLTFSGDCPPLPAPLPREGTRLGDQLAFPDRLPDWLPAADLAELVDTFTGGGLTGALNYYRAMDSSWAKVPELGASPVRCPALFLAGERDPVLSFTPTRHLRDGVPLLEGPVLLPGAGHWVQREAPAEVTARLVPWCSRHVAGLR